MEILVGVSNQLCHAEPQDAENVKKILLISSFYSVVLMLTICNVQYKCTQLLNQLNQVRLPQMSIILYFLSFIK